MPSKRPRKPTPSSPATGGGRSPKPAATTRAPATRSKKRPKAAPTTRPSAKPAPAAPPARTAGPARADLLKQAAAAGLPGYQRMTVAQLTAALTRRDERPAPRPAAREASERLPVVATSASAAGLPRHYDVTEVVAMPVDPLLVHVYWELRPDAVARVRRDLGAAWDGARQVLRAYELGATASLNSDHAARPTHADHHFDSDVDGNVGGFYVHLWSPGHALIFELGWRGRSGRFVAAARSHAVRTPRNSPSAGEERWMTVRHGRILATPQDAIPTDHRDTAPIEPAPWSATFPAHRGWGGRQ